jgi:hypothetical protein
MTNNPLLSLKLKYVLAIPFMYAQFVVRATIATNVHALLIKALFLILSVFSVKRKLLAKNVLVLKVMCAFMLKSIMDLTFARFATSVVLVKLANAKYVNYICM